MNNWPLPESAGTFSQPDEKLYKCFACGKETARMKVWESHDGAYTDYKYTCTDPKCGKVHWVDGIDS